MNGQVQLKINFLRSDGLTQTVTLMPSELALVGRDPSCHCRLDGRKVSRRHVRLKMDALGAPKVEDMGSHNGTFLNGARITESALKRGDRLTVGEWEGEVQLLVGPDRRGTQPGMPAISSSLPSANSWEGFTDEKTGGIQRFSSLPSGTQRAEISLPKAPVETTDKHATRAMDLRGTWQWDEAFKTGSGETLRALPVTANPIVQRLSKQSSTKLDFRGIAGPAGGLNETPDVNVDAVALQMVFKVTEALASSSTLDGFLAEMAEEMCSAARAKSVVVLQPGDEGEMVPRVMKNRRSGENIQISRTILEHAVSQKAAIATEDASNDERFAAGESILKFDLKAVLVVPLVHHDEVTGAVYLAREIPFTDMERDLVAAVSHMVSMALERSRLREKVEIEEKQRRALERFHAPDVVRKLMMEGDAEESPKKRDGLFLEPLTATVLFCDLSGFTTFCESTSAEMVGKILNLYLGAMTEIVFEYGGTVDKYIGDAIMCIFGAPFMAEDDPVRAVKCASAMRRGFEEVIRPALGDKGDELHVHIGVNTGKVVAGTVGSAIRMEYTALGDTVNVAARLEGVATKGQIVIGPDTADLVKDEVELQSLGEVSLKGRGEAVEVFEVIG